MMVIGGRAVQLESISEMVSRELASRGIRRPSVLIENDYQSTAMHKEAFDGAIRHDGLVWSTYIHGVFDEPGFRRGWLNRARLRKRLPALDIHVSMSVTIQLQDELDRWAAHLSRNVNLTCLLR